MDAIVTISSDKSVGKDDDVKVSEEAEDICCPCSGGMSCIVERRCRGDWVHEDDVLLAAGLQVRTHCFSEPTLEQKAAMRAWMIENLGYDGAKSDDTVGDDGTTGVTKSDEEVGDSGTTGVAKSDEKQRNRSRSRMFDIYIYIYIYKSMEQMRDRADLFSLLQLVRSTKDESSFCYFLVLLWPIEPR